MCVVVLSKMGAIHSYLLGLFILGRLFTLSRAGLKTCDVLEFFLFSQTILFLKVGKNRNDFMKTSFFPFSNEILKIISLEFGKTMSS